MIRKPTGRILTPMEFNRKVQCVQCGLACDIRNGQKCSECSLVDIPICDICEIVLRSGYYKMYAYDIKEEYRHTGIEYKVNKTTVKEFTYRKLFDRKSDIDGLCKDCIDWEYRMKNKCWLCKSKFVNTKDNYKNNGNMCKSCSNEFICQ